MKDSGVEWIGEIPEDWNIRKLKSIITCRDGERVPIDSALRESGPYPYWGAGNITDYINNYLFDEELVLLGEDGAPFFDKKRNVAFLVKGKVWVNNHIHVLKADKEVISSYLVHFLNIVDFGCYINGSILNKLTQSNMNRISVAFPSKYEQQKIANFLDEKVGEIDSVIAKTKETIEDYKKYKQTIITDAVTKGLNPDVEMKDSGIEWIKKVPITWERARIGYNSWIRARLGWKGLKAEEYVDEGYAFLSAFNIINNKLDWDNLNYITQDRYDESPEIKLCIGDIILVKDGAGIGKCARIDTLPVGGATTNGSLAVISTYDNITYEYLYYYLQSCMLQNYIFRIMNGMGVPHLSQEELRKIIIPVPPLKEQKDIAYYLEKKCVEIDASIDEKKQQLGVLEQYKKSLIYEYVTGKKEVSNNNG